MSDEYQRVLHEWARHQLETKSQHVGPFTILAVRMYWSDSYGTYEHPAAELNIMFDHGPACTLFPRHLSKDRRCTSGMWLAEEQHMVTVLNELFAIAAES